MSNDSKKFDLQRYTDRYETALGLSASAKIVLNNLDHPQLGNDPSGDAILLYTTAINSTNADRSQRIEKATAYALIMNSDALCEKYMVDFLKDSKSTVSMLQITSLGFSTSASLLKPASSANLLSGLSSFTSGTEEKLKKTVLGDREPELLYRAVMAERSRERTRLLTLLGSNISEGNTAGVVMSQINDYHAKCGMNFGIISLSTSVDAAAEKAAQDGRNQAQDFLKGLTQKAH